MKTFIALVLLAACGCDLLGSPAPHLDVTSQRCTHGCGPDEVDDLRD